MKKLGSNGVKNLKIAHLIFVMLWTTGVVIMAMLLLINAESGDELYMKYKLIRLIDDAIVIPGAIITSLIGVIYGLKTNWGFFEHKWITAKWIVSIIVIIVGTFVLSPMLDSNIELANTMRDSAISNSDIQSRTIIIFASGCCSAIALLVLVAISVIKPWRKKK